MPQKDKEKCENELGMFDARCSKVDEYRVLRIECSACGGKGFVRKASVKEIPNKEVLQK